MRTLPCLVALGLGAALLAGCGTELPASLPGSTAEVPPVAPVHAETAALMPSWPQGAFELTGTDRDRRRGLRTVVLARGTRGEECRYEQRSLYIAGGLPGTGGTEPGEGPETESSRFPSSISYRIYVGGDLYVAEDELSPAEAARLQSPGAGPGSATELLRSASPEGLKWERRSKLLDQHSTPDGSFLFSENLCTLPTMITQAYATPEALASGVSQIELPGSPVWSLTLDPAGYSAYQFRGGYEISQDEGRRWSDKEREVMRELSDEGALGEMYRDIHRIRVTTAGEETRLEYVLVDKEEEAGGAYVRSADAVASQTLAVRPLPEPPALQPPASFEEYVRTK